MDNRYSSPQFADDLASITIARTSIRGAPAYKKNALGKPGKGVNRSTGQVKQSNRKRRMRQNLRPLGSAHHRILNVAVLAALPDRPIANTGLKRGFVMLVVLKHGVSVEYIAPVAGNAGVLERNLEAHEHGNSQ